MSNTVDTRVVEMQFNNRNFEQNVRTSLGTLDKLKNALNFGKSSQQLANLQNGVNNVDFSPFANALDSVQNRFSTLGIVGATVISNLTSSLMGKAKQLLTAIPNQISQGGLARALNIEQAKFMLEGLDVEWDKISADINYGVDKTAYGLDAAAKAASQLVASGVDFGDTYGTTGNSPMAKALRGISGVAAMTNSSYEEISSIFTTVAGQGKLMTMQLRQLESRGLNAAAQMGKVMGKTEEQVRDMVTKGQIDFKMFSEAMNEAFGDQAAKANETYTGALSNVKAALSRIGAEFKASRIENLRQIFVSAIPVINNIKKQMAGLTTVINGMSTAVKDRLVKAFQFFDPEHGVSSELFPVKKLIGTMITGETLRLFEKFATVLSQIGGAFSRAFSSVFFTGAALDKWASVILPTFRKFIDSIKLSDDALKRIESDLKIILGAFNGALKVAMSALSGLFKIGRAILEVFGPLFWLAKMLTVDIFSQLNSIFPNLAEEITFITDNIANAISKFAKKSTPLIENFIWKIKDLVDIWFVNSNLFMRFGNIVSAILAGIRKGISDLYSVLSSRRKGSKDGLSDLETRGALLDKTVSTLKEKLYSLKDLAAKVASFLGESLSQLWTNFMAPFKNNNTNFLLSFIAALEVALTTLISLRSVSAIKELEWSFKSFKGIADTIKGTFWNITATMKKVGNSLQVWQNTLKADFLLKIGKAIGLIAVSMLVLSLIDKDKLLGVSAAITVFIAELTAAMGSLSSLKLPGKMKLVGLSSVLVSLGIAILLLSTAAKSLSGLNWNELKTGLAGITVILAELGMFISVSKLDKGKGLKTATTLIGIAAAVYILAGALSKLSEINPDTLGTGLGAMAAIFGVLAIFTNIVNSKRIVGVGLALVLVAASLNMFAKGLTTIGEIPLNTLKTGLLGMATALSAVALAISVMPKGSAFNGMALVIAASSLLILADALKRFSEIDPNKLGTGLVGMSWALAAIAGAMMLMKTALPGAAALLVVSFAMKTLAGVVERFAKIPVDKMVAALVAFGSALTIVVMAGMGAIGAAEGLLVLGAAVTLIGAGFLMAGTGILAFASGLALLATVGGAGIAALVLGLTNLINLIPIFLTQLGYGIIALVDVLANGYDSFVKFGVTLITATCDGFIQTLPKITELINVLLDTLETVFFEQAPRLVTMGIDLVLMLLDGITEALPELVDKSFVLIITFIDSMSGALEQHGQEFWDAVDRFIISLLEFLGLKVRDWADTAKKWIDGLKDGFNEKKEELKEKAKEIVDAVVEKIKGLWTDFKNAGAFLIQGFLNGLESVPIIGPVVGLGRKIISHFNSSLGEHSPSKLTEMSGEYFIEGFVNGINKNAYKAVQATDGVIDALEINGDKITLFDHVVRAIELNTKKFVEKSVETINWGAKTVDQFISGFGQSLFDNKAFANGKEMEFATKAITDLSKSLYLNSQEYKESSANVQEYVNTIKKQEDEIAKLNKEIKSQDKATSNSLKKYENASKKVETIEKSIESIQDSINNTSDKYTKNTLREQLNLKKKELKTAKEAESVASKAYNESQKKLDNLNNELENAKYNLQNLGSGLSEELANIANGARKAFENLREGISDTMKGSLDILKVSVTNYVDLFSKFEEIENIPVERILKTMRSQIVGVSKWRDNLTELGKRGIAEGLLEQLRSMGVDGAKYIQTFLKMTDEELEQANLMFRAKNELTSQTLIDGMKDQFKAVERWTSNIEHLAERGINFDMLMDLQEAGPDNAEYVQALADMTSEQIKEVNELYKKSKELPTNIADRVLSSLALSNQGRGNIAGKEMASALAEVLNGSDIGEKFTEALAVGIKKSETDIVEASKVIGKSSMVELNKYFSTENGSYVAINMVDGMVNGLKSGQSIIADASRELARAAYGSMTDELGIHSPSRAFESIGRFSDMGLANGLLNYSSLVENASEKLGRDTLKTMRESMNRVSEMLSNDVNSPVIKPILDLSEVSNDAGRINRMFGDQTIGTNLEELPGIQNGKVFNFTQNNYSPKSLSRIEIYRQTKNQFSTLKGMV